MSKIRADLVGAVMAGGHLLAAGQDVPEGVDVHESLVDDTAKSESGEAASGEEDTAEDYSDLLGDEEETKSSAKAPARGGRKSASTKRS